MPNTDQAELAQFHKLCEISVIVEEDGSNPVLCASVSVRDSNTGEYHDFKRSIALAPIMKALAAKIRQYHDKYLHSGNTQVRGENHWRGLGQDYDAPRDNYFLDASEYTDTQGLPPGVDPLQVQGWFDKIKKVARSVGEVKVVKGLYGEMKTYGKQAEAYAKAGAKFAAANKGALAMAASAIPGGSAALETSFKVYDAVKAAQKQNPEAMLALKKIKALAESGDLKAVQAFKAAQTMNDMMKAKHQNMHVSGWLYNRPYRTNTQVIADGLTGKFPTVGIALRQGWHDALSFAGSMNRKNYGPMGG